MTARRRSEHSGQNKWQDLGRGIRGMSRLIEMISAAHVRRHPGQTCLIIVTVALGVTAIVATGNLVESALASIEGTHQATGEFADLRIANGFAGVAEELVQEIRETDGVTSAGAVIVATARLHLQNESTDSVLIGIDLLANDSVHQASFSRDRIEIADETDFLTRPEAIALDRAFAHRHGLQIGSAIEGDFPGGRRQLYVAGLLQPNRASALFGGALVLMDLPAAQLILDRGNLVDAIDVKASNPMVVGELERRLTSKLAGRATVSVMGRESREWASLLFGVRMVLGLTGAIAIVVGALVIYHAVSISVSQRKANLDIVRAIGASQRSLLALLSGEGLALGLVGAVLGAAIGVVVAWAAAGLFQESVASLYVPLATSTIRLSRDYLAWGAALGVLVTWAAGTAPARGAMRIGSGVDVTSRGRERWRTSRRLALGGTLAATVGYLLPALESSDLRPEALTSFIIVADALVLVGVGFATPLILLLISPLVAGILRGSRTLTLRLAWQGLVSDPGRSATVITAILLGSSYVIYTVAAVGSIREGVLHWMEGTQESDLVVSAAGSIGLLPSSPPIPGDIAVTLESQPGVKFVEPIRLVAQPFEDRWVVIASRNPEVFGERQPTILLSGDLERARQAMQSGNGVIATQVFAVRSGHRVGDTIELRTPGGPARFEIGAVIDDYGGGDLGTVFVAPETFRRLWRDSSVTAFDVWLDNGADPDLVRRAIELGIRGHCNCSVLTRAEVHSRSASIVDSIFYTAYALEFVAGLVMVVSMVSFFMITLGERTREIRLLATVGATRGQLVRTFISEAIALGLIGGGIGCITGLALSWRFVHSALRVGLGLVFEFVVPLEAIAFVLSAAVVVSALAALPPVLHASRSIPISRAGMIDE